jgi:hypothetical protein
MLKDSAGHATRGNTISEIFPRATVKKWLGSCYNEMQCGRVTSLRNLSIRRSTKKYRPAATFFWTWQKKIRTVRAASTPGTNK